MKYKSCRLLEHGLSFYNKGLYPCCCRNHEGRGEILLIPEYFGEEINWEKLCADRSRFTEIFKKGEIPKECKGCTIITEEDWTQEQYINYIHINHWTHCNSNCVYCYTSKYKRFYNNFKPYDIYPALEKLINQNHVSENTLIEFAGGECTILENFEKLMELFISKNYFIKINSSAVKYSKTIETALSQGLLNLVVSIDAGNESTYKKIKQIDVFQKVCTNLTNYIKHQCLDKNNSYGKVMIKYIIIPNYNDSIKEIDSWIEKCKKLNCENIIIDVEHVWYTQNTEELPEYIYSLLDYAKLKAEKEGFKFSYMDGADLVLSERNKYNYTKRNNLLMLKLNTFINKFLHPQKIKYITNIKM